MELHDREILRGLAVQWMELASKPVMEERKRLWRAVKDLKSERPMIYVESWTPDFTLQCAGDFERRAEAHMRSSIGHFYAVGDDIVIEPYFRLPWRVTKSGYGQPFTARYAIDSFNRKIGFKYDYQIKTPADAGQIKRPVFTVDRKQTLLYKEILEDVFKNIMPVKTGNFDFFNAEAENYLPGDNPGTGINFITVSYDLIRLMGDKTFSYWVYDYPELIHEIVRHISDSYIEFYKWLEYENLLDLNDDNQFSGPGSYGYTSGLPKPGTGKICLKNVWARTESQESVMLSPGMFNEYILYYISKVCELFGLIYYGCCEPLDDRFGLIKKAIPNLRAVSVSGWSDVEKMGEMLGKDYVFSRKPHPMAISGANADWDGAKTDLTKTYNATKNGHLEIIVRDVIDVGGDKHRFRNWVNLAKSILNF